LLSAGRMSMPSTVSPDCRPLTGAVVHSFCADVLLNETSALDSVSASNSPTGCTGVVAGAGAASPKMLSPAFNAPTWPTFVAAPVIRSIV
jgi:hypothetical protein